MKNPDIFLSNTERPARLLVKVADDGTLETMPATIYMGSPYASGFSSEYPASSAGTLVVRSDVSRVSCTKSEV